MEDPFHGFQREYNEEQAEQIKSDLRERVQAAERANQRLFVAMVKYYPYIYHKAIYNHYHHDRRWQPVKQDKEGAGEAEIEEASSEDPPDDARTRYSYMKYEELGNVKHLRQTGSALATSNPQFCLTRVLRFPPRPCLPPR